MSQPEYMGGGPIAPMQEPAGAGTPPAPAQQPASEPLSQKRGLIIAVLIGVNILCLAAIAAVAGSSKKDTRAAVEQSAKKDGESEAPAKKADAKQDERGAEEPSAAADTPKDAPKKEDKEAAVAGGSAKGGGERAVVSLPPGRARGVLRQKPDAHSGVVVNIPAGTTVEVVNKVAVKGQTWYEVKTVDFDPPSTGYMHENVLKMQ